MNIITLHMDQIGLVMLIEVILVFGGVLLFSIWQLRDLKKEQKKRLRKKNLNEDHKS